ncbi:hypothetical protein L210DRAFT_3509228 [Boletus edulis BED1]|uniref:Uncharacterized protein n=1 Tax=Boletus edulis BED1 TaxID=1328754 RepID=A0AAD4G8J8_BOLED|nr:hypothetical protein L210DRAFT_3509228 [Boletus edulis BED1]
MRQLCSTFRDIPPAGAPILWQDLHERAFRCGFGLVAIAILEGRTCKLMPGNHLGELPLVYDGAGIYFCLRASSGCTGCLDERFGCGLGSQVLEKLWSRYSAMSSAEMKAKASLVKCMVAVGMRMLLLWHGKGRARVECGSWMLWVSSDAKMSLPCSDPATLACSGPDGVRAGPCQKGWGHSESPTERSRLNFDCRRAMRRTLRSPNAWELGATNLEGRNEGECGRNAKYTGRQEQHASSMFLPPLFSNRRVPHSRWLSFLAGRPTFVVPGLFFDPFGRPRPRFTGSGILEFVSEPTRASSSGY